jgi:hypothetical protein
MADKPVTLREYATQLDQADQLVLRQTGAYDLFRNVTTGIATAMEAESSEGLTLPTIFVKMAAETAADNGDVAHEIYELDLNAVPLAQLPLIKPLFDLFAASAGESMMNAWEAVSAVNNNAQQLIATARQKQQAAGAPVISGGNLQGGN